MLEVVAENLTVEYELIREKETLTALWDFNLKVPAGEFLVVVGPSGCGKTTFINVVVGLVTPSQGRILCGGKVINGPGHDRAMVFQDYALMPWRTIQKNVEFGLELQGRLNADSAKKRPAGRRAKDARERNRSTDSRRHVSPGIHPSRFD